MFWNNNTLFSSGVNFTINVIDSPGPTLWWESGGDIILKYGVSTCETLTNLGTYNNKYRLKLWFAKSNIFYFVVIT